MLWFFGCLFVFGTCYALIALDDKRQIRLRGLLKGRDYENLSE